jgi:hypothetical protein
MARQVHVHRFLLGNADLIKPLANFVKTNQAVAIILQIFETIFRIFFTAEQESVCSP